MRRRDFIGLVGGAMAWPLATLAEQPVGIRRIGVLHAQVEDTENRARHAALQQELQSLGWVDGRNVQIETRWGGGNTESIRNYAAQLVALAPDAIVAVSAAVVAPLLQATRTVPIVFVLVADPVGAGFVNSLARPRHNATGFTALEYSFGGKWLELLREIAPNVTHAVVIRDARDSAGIGLFSAVQSAASSAGVELNPVDVRDLDEMDRGSLHLPVARIAV